MISKELVNAVLGYEIAEILPFNKDENFIEYTRFPISTDAGIWEDLNIYELAHKCKLWANTKGYTIIDYIDLDNDEFWTCRAYPNGLNDGFDWEETYQPTSPISIFRTCQWILDNVKTNSLS